MRARMIAPQLIGLLLLLGALLAGLIVGIAIGRKLMVRASMGEALVANAIEGCLQRPHVLLNNVTLPTPKGTTQIDHILICESGVFVIETKHYQGWIFGNPNDAHWQQVIYHKKSRFQNPLRQNYGHVETLRALLTLPSETFIPLVVFTGRAEFKTDLGPSVIHLHKLSGFLNHPRPAVLDERKMAYVIGRIEMKRLRRSLETDEYHINYVRQRVR